MKPTPPPPPSGEEPIFDLEVANRLIFQYETELKKINRRSKTDSLCTIRDLGHMAARAIREGQRTKENQ